MIGDAKIDAGVRVAMAARRAAGARVRVHPSERLPEHALGHGSAVLVAAVARIGERARGPAGA